MTVRPPGLTRRVAAALSVPAVLAVSCGGDDPEPAAPDAPELDVCVDPLGKPMEFEDSESPGDYLGMSVELIEAITGREGVVISWKPTAEANIERYLRDGRCDVALAPFVDETDGIRYTRPYLDHQVAAARLASGPPFPSIEFVTGRRIGARRNSLSREWLASNLPSGAAIVSFPSTGDIVAALKASRVDSLRPTAVEAIVDDWSALAYRSKNDPELVLFQSAPTGRSRAMAVREDDDETFELIDAGLEELLADGTVESISAEMFFPAAE